MSDGTSISAYNNTSNSNSNHQYSNTNGPRKNAQEHVPSENGPETKGDDGKATNDGEASVPSPITVPSRKRLYVSNLKWQVNEDRLRQEFAKFGVVTEVRVVRDRRSGWSRGFGFVSFGSSESATAAMDTMNGTELEGRQVRIEFARSSGPTVRQHAYDEDGDDPYVSGGDHDESGFDYSGMDPATGYCLPLAQGYTAYIPGQYCDPHIPYQYIPSGYYQPRPIDMMVHQMQMMALDSTTPSHPLRPHGTKGCNNPGCDNKQSQ